MLEQSQQQRDDLEDATFTVEQEHKTVMEEIHRLYRESMASYESAHEDRVSHADTSFQAFSVRREGVPV